MRYRGLLLAPAKLSAGAHAVITRDSRPQYAHHLGQYLARLDHPTPIARRAQIKLGVTRQYRVGWDAYQPGVQTSPDAHTSTRLRRHYGPSLKPKFAVREYKPQYA